MVSGSYDNSFALIDALSGNTALVQAQDDAREPLVLQHNTTEQLPAAIQRLCTTQQLDTHSLHSPFARCYTPAVHSVGAAVSVVGGSSGDSGRGSGSGSGSGGSGSSSDSGQQQQQQQLSSVAQQQKILKVAWHPHMEAVAVAGLYKLYLYQNRQAAHSTDIGRT